MTQIARLKAALDSGEKVTLAKADIEELLQEIVIRETARAPSEALLIALGVPKVTLAEIQKGAISTEQLRDGAISTAEFWAQAR